MNLDPSAEYQRRLQIAELQSKQLSNQANRIGNGRLLAAIGAGAIAWLAWSPHLVSPWLLLLPAILFLGLVAQHQGVLARRQTAERAVRYYGEALRRVADAWSGTGSAGERFRNPAHVYADDLDVFGQGSLFQLLCRARTSFGEATLAGWLLAPAEVETVPQRQRAAEELADRLDLREDIALLASEASGSLHADVLETWARLPPLPVPGWAQPFAFALAIAGVVTGALALAGRLPLSAFLLIFIADVCFAFSLRKQLAQGAAGAELPASELDLLSKVLARLERERFQTPAGIAIAEVLNLGGLPASKRIARLRRLVELLDSSDHFIIRVLDPVLLWRAQIIMALEQWRNRNRLQIEGWLRAVGDFEALSSLACLRYERPSWTTPELVPGPEHASLHAVALRHPLLPAVRAVSNDVTLNREQALLIISGSNMSGKSTLLRALGLNTVLAWAGGPVCADRLTVSRLQVGASLRVTDSLQDNRSRFLAEITRLRSIVALTELRDRRVLFLLDELLSGTNSHDRRIGAQAIVESLLRAGAVGLLTTHDLALSDIAAELGTAAANAHFQDTIADGAMHFDYRLHPGVVTHSNALALMRAIGLPV